MPDSTSEYVVDLLLELLPSLLPAPVDSAAKAAIGVFKSRLEGLLMEPRLRRELLSAAREAENQFRSQALKTPGNEGLVQAVASFPLYDRERFQRILRDLPNHLDEEYIAATLIGIVGNDWKGKLDVAEIRDGLAMYLNCLRIQLLKVAGYAELVTRLATLRTDVRTEQILAGVSELLQSMNVLIDRTSMPFTSAPAYYTVRQPVKDFIGRESPIKLLKQELAHGALVCGVSGAGGIGKTELARKLADELAADFPDARLEIDLAGDSDQPLSSEKAMRQLLEPFYHDNLLPAEFTSLRGLYQETFSKNKALLLLDNAAGVSQVRPLVPPPPSAAVITSRQYFSLTEFGLREPLSLDLLSTQEAGEFLRTASHKLSDSPDPLVDELVTLCGHLPLALRVVASLLNDRQDWNPEVVLERLSDEHTRLGRLKRPGDTDLDVEAAISLSYKQLSEKDTQRFRQLGVLTRFFSRQTLLPLWNAGDEEVDQSIGVLLARNLLYAYPGPFLNMSTGEVIRNNLYGLHDLTRLFAADRLLEDPEEARSAVERHAEYSLQVASLANREYQRGNEHAAIGLDLMRFILQDLLAAWQRMLPDQHVWPRPLSADEWLSWFYGGCALVLNLQMPARQRVQILTTTLDASRRTSNRRAEAGNLINLGGAYDELDNASEAMHCYEQALIIAREVGDRGMESSCLSNLGNSHLRLGDHQAAIEFQEKALTISRELGDKRSEAGFLVDLASAVYGHGDVNHAIAVYLQALAVFEEMGDIRSKAVVLNNLAMAYTDIKQTAEAIEFGQQALMIVRELRDRYGETKSLNALGAAYAKHGNPRKAIELHELAWTISREIGNRWEEESALANLSSSYQLIGEHRLAIEFSERALSIARETGNAREECHNLGNLGSIYLQFGIFRKGLELTEQALTIARRLGDWNAETKALTNMARALTERGQIEEARHLLSSAQSVYRAHEDPRASEIEASMRDLGASESHKPDINLEDFIRETIRMHRKGGLEVQQRFAQVSKTARDSTVPMEFQELGKVLQLILAGVDNPDLSSLPEDLVTIIRQELSA